MRECQGGDRDGRQTGMSEYPHIGPFDPVSDELVGPYPAPGPVGADIPIAFDENATVNPCIETHL
jgi:hypothetical protein